VARVFDPRTQRLIDELAADQEGVVSRAQLLTIGATRTEISTRLEAGIWRSALRRTYVTHSGPLSYRARVWSALLYVGDGAMACLETAAYLHRLTDAPPDHVHVLLPADRRVMPQSGLQLHLATHASERLQVGSSPARTTVEDTVLDLIETKKRPDEVVGLLTSGCQRRLTTPARILVASERRKKIAWRPLLREVLRDVTQGAESALEVRYLRDVERAHGLPRGTRQVVVVTAQCRQTDDVHYEEFGVVVELDGIANHDGEHVFRDMARDNATVVRRQLALRYGWRDVFGRPCATAEQVATVLQQRGWEGKLRRCPRCR
jgi:hypothetical protein